MSLLPQHAAPTAALPFHPAANVFPLLEGDEFEALKADISAHGLLDEITLLGGQILDGRNRERACRTAGVPPRYREFPGGDPFGFVISMNLQRRHLNESQRAMIAAKIATMRQGARTDIAQTCAMSQADAAAALSVSRRSVQYATQVRTRGAPALIIAVEGGKLAVSTGAEIAELPLSEQAKIVKRSEKAIIRAATVIKVQRKAARRSERQAVYAAAAATVPNISRRYTVHHAPCIDALKLLAAESVDLFITDPPYGAEFLPLFSDLSKVAAHALKLGGLAFVMAGHTHLPEVMRRLDSHLTFGWPATYLTPNSNATISSPIGKIAIGHKPVLVYYKPGGQRTDRVFRDVYRSGAPDKRYHEWGQSESGIMEMMRDRVRPGDVVVDPFIGGGTTAIVTLKLGATLIGFDTDQKAIEATLARIAAIIQEEGAQ